MSATTLANATAVSQLMSGAFAMESGKKTASSLRDQARLIQAEAEVDAQNYESEARSFKASQKLRYLKSGVEIDGSPLDILDETTRVANEKLSAIRAGGVARARDLKNKAYAARTTGRMEFLKGFATAAKNQRVFKNTRGDIDGQNTKD